MWVFKKKEDCTWVIEEMGETTKFALDRKSKNFTNESFI